VVKAHPRGAPGWRIAGIVAKPPRTGDWQAYDKIVLACTNPLAETLAAGINLHDEIGKQILFRYKIEPGSTEIEIPLSAAETINLEKIADAAVLFVAKEDEDYPVFIKRLSLKRSEGKRVILVDSPDDKAGPGDWLIDLTRFYDSRGDRRLADITIPYGGPEGTLIVKCRPVTTRSFRFVLPASVASKCRKGPCRAAGFYINRGEMLLYFGSVTPAVEGQTTTLAPVRGLGP